MDNLIPGAPLHQSSSSRPERKRALILQKRAAQRIAHLSALTGKKEAEIKKTAQGKEFCNCGGSE
jgi:hypothetical protein